MWVAYSLLSVVFWAWINVLDSLLIARFKKSPVVFMCSQAIFSVPTLAILFFMKPVSYLWAPVLIVAGCVTYIADIFFIWILDRIDVSVVNIAWSILAVLLSAVGILVFHEQWSVLQLIGAIMILCSVMIISFSHYHVSIGRTIGLLTLLAITYMPFYVAQKAALNAGLSFTTVFFWPIAARETIALVIPLFIPRHRAHMRRIFLELDWKFFLINAVVIVLFFFGTAMSIFAYKTGPLSLIAIVNNIQPFAVILFAWALSFWPTLSARELLTRESLRVKLVSFLIAFFGLALISIS